MHGSSMNEKRCIADSLYLREAGYSVLVLGFYFWKGMSKKMRAIPVEYVERAAAELKKNGYEKIGIHGISSGAAYALLCASLISDISLVLSICPFDYIVEEPKIIGKRPDVPGSAIAEKIIRALFSPGRGRKAFLVLCGSTGSRTQSTGVNF